MRVDSQAGEVAGPALVTPRHRRTSPALFRELVVHLARRELDATHRMTLLGWAWPLTRQLAQLAVLVFVFSSLLDLGIRNFPVFVFSGLIAWNWFSTGTSAATYSLISQRHLVFQPRLPAAVIPIVAVAVPLVDVLLALPVLVVLLLLGDGVPVTALGVPALVVVQLVLMAGVAWLTSAASVYFRDVPNVVGVALTLLFYMTPVFYGARVIPDRYEDILRLNPLTVIVETYRALLLDQPFPPAPWELYLCVVAVAMAVAGLWLFLRLQGRFVDYL
jgi:lipopolysaccharide transport system permease protein